MKANVLSQVGIAVGFSALALSASTASAQEEDADGAALLADNGAGVEEPYRLGAGFKVSEDLRLQPQLDLMGGFQTNVFYEEPGDRTDGEVVSSPLLRVGVGARLSNENDEAEYQRLLLEGDVGLTWHQYLSSQDTVTSQSDLGINANVGLKVNPAGTVSFELRDTFARAVSPPPTETELGLDRDRNVLLAGVTVRPGGGALSIYGNLTWTLDLFEENSFAFADRQSFIGAVGARWQWLPKTQVNGEASFGLNIVDENALKVDTSGSTPLRVWAGVSTLLTPNFGTILRLGYGNGFYDGGNFNSYLALAEARYAFGPAVRLAGGYSHDFADAIIGNYRADHALYARFTAQLAGRFQFNAKGEVRFRSYDGVPAMATGGTQFCTTGDGACVPGREDVISRLETGFEMQANEWLLVGATYTLLVNSTDSVVRSAMIVDSNAFTWQEFMVKATAKF